MILILHESVYVLIHDYMWLDLHTRGLVLIVSQILVIRLTERSNISGSSQNSHIHRTYLDTPVTNLIPAVWFTKPPVSGTTQVYSPVGDV